MIVVLIIVTIITAGILAIPCVLFCLIYFLSKMSQSNQYRQKKYRAKHEPYRVVCQYFMVRYSVKVAYQRTKQETIRELYFHGFAIDEIRQALQFMRYYKVLFREEGGQANQTSPLPVPEYAWVRNYLYGSIERVGRTHQGSYLLACDVPADYLHKMGPEISARFPLKEGEEDQIMKDSYIQWLVRNPKKNSDLGEEIIPTILSGYGLSHSEVGRIEIRIKNERKIVYEQH